MTKANKKAAKAVKTVETEMPSIATIQAVAEIPPARAATVVAVASEDQPEMELLSRDDFKPETTAEKINAALADVGKDWLTATKNTDGTLVSRTTLLVAAYIHYRLHSAVNGISTDASGQTAKISVKPDKKALIKEIRERMAIPDEYQSQTYDAAVTRATKAGMLLYSGKCPVHIGWRTSPTIRMEIEEPMRGQSYQSVMIDWSYLEPVIKGAKGKPDVKNTSKVFVAMAYADIDLVYDRVFHNLPVDMYGKRIASARAAHSNSTAVAVISHRLEGATPTQLLDAFQAVADDIAASKINPTVEMMVDLVNALLTISERPDWRRLVRENKTLGKLAQDLANTLMATAWNEKDAAAA